MHRRRRSRAAATTLLVVGALAASRPAYAQALSEAVPGESQWYGLSQTLADVGLLGLGIFGRSQRSGEVMGFSVGAQIIQAPIFHLIYGNWRRALLSFGLRAAVAATGLFVGSFGCIANSSCDGSTLLVGPMVAVQIMAIIDDAGIARLKIPAEATRNEPQEPPADQPWSFGPVMLPDGGGISAAISW